MISLLYGLKWILQISDILYPKKSAARKIICACAAAKK